MNVKHLELRHLQRLMASEVPQANEYSGGVASIWRGWTKGGPKVEV